MPILIQYHYLTSGHYVLFWAAITKYHGLGVLSTTEVYFSSGD